MEELIRTYGPQGAILAAVVLYLRQVMEARIAREAEICAQRLADAALVLSKAERERDEYKALAFRSVAATEKVASTVATPQVTP